MKRLTQIAMVGIFLLAVVSIAGAQQALQPVVRLGNFTGSRQRSVHAYDCDDGYPVYHGREPGL